jgi:predicted transcriptional regulator
MAEPLRRRLKDALGITARVVPQSELGNLSQYFDDARRQFLISSQLRAENRTFALAYQLALVEFAVVLERMVIEAAPPDGGIAQLLHMSLANYAAGAIMMPYGRFLAACNACAICPRTDCGHRATAPAGRMLTVDRLQKTISPTRSCRREALQYPLQQG